MPSEESNKDELSSAILQQHQHQQREPPHQPQGLLGGDLPQQPGHPHVDLLARLKALSNSAGAQRHSRCSDGARPVGALCKCMCIQTPAQEEGCASSAWRPAHALPLFTSTSFAVFDSILVDVSTTVTSEADLLPTHLQLLSMGKTISHTSMG